MPTPTPTLQLRHATSHDREQLPFPLPPRPLQPDAAVGRRDLDPGAERRLVEGDRNLEHEVVAAALVELRRLDARDHVEVARGRAAEAGLSLALELDLRAVLDAGGGAGRVALSSARPPRGARGRAAPLPN